MLDNPELPENAYVMKAIMRCLAESGKSVVLPVASEVLSKQCVYLAHVSFLAALVLDEWFIIRSIDDDLHPITYLFCNHYYPGVTKPFQPTVQSLPI